MSIKYISLSRLGINRGPKSSQLSPAFRRRATYLNPTVNNTTVSLGAVAHTKSAWVQVTASTSTAVGLFRFKPSTWAGFSATTHATLLDIGVGAAGSEVVVVPNLAVGGQYPTSTEYDIPIAIPAGRRVAIRAQGARTSASVGFNINLISATDSQTTPASVDVLGTSTANSSGTAMSGSSGTYVQITAATTRDYQSLILIPSSTSGLTVQYVTAILTLAVGAAGSEVDITQCLAFGDGGQGISPYSVRGEFGGGLIPSGSRIAVRHNLASSPGWLSACVIGVPYV